MLDRSAPYPDNTDNRTIHERIEAARPHFKPVVRNAEGQVGTRHYNYADLDVVCDAVEAALLAEGVGIFPSISNAAVEVVLRILDSPGAGFGSWAVGASIPLPADLTPQQTGSAITYFRRYGLVALLNLRTEPDDDGSSASRTRAPEAPAVTAPSPPAGWESTGAAVQAHKDLSARIRSIPEDMRTPCTDFTAAHGWPLSLDKFEELERTVKVIEEFGPPETQA
jgi:ERF superfamily